MMKSIPETVRQRAKIALARRDFYEYCKLLAPDFYRDDRPYIKKLCDDLQEFLDSENRILVLNAPPRHGKSRTAGKLVEWILGRDKTKKIMTCSYNETLSTKFSKSVRDTIQTEKIEENKIVYNDIFPNVKIKKGDGAAQLWAVEGEHISYVATSPGGTATGFGADILIVDDVIKNAYEAMHAPTKDAHWDWFRQTISSRLEDNGKIIIIMTRWATDDLAGRVLKHFENSQKWPMKHISLKAKRPDGKMLCDAILSLSDFEEKKRLMGQQIALANFQQEPIDLSGQLYTNLQTYDKLPTDANGNFLFSYLKSYTDTADTGKDYLCHIQYGIYNEIIYILDVLYTQNAMEYTEPEVAKMLKNRNIKDAWIESNNGGRGFARNVQRLLGVRSKCTIHTFTQTKNKISRILSQATDVMRLVRFPADWCDRWPEFSDAILRYQRTGKNSHDDAPDALTGVVEKMGLQNGGVRTLRGSF